MHMAQRNGRHGRDEVRGRAGRIMAIVVTAVVALALALSAAAVAGARHRARIEASASASATSPSSTTPTQHQTAAANKDGTPAKDDATKDNAANKDDATKDGDANKDGKDDAVVRAQRIVDAMSPDERAAQLVMAPLAAGTDPSALASLIGDDHVGSVILMGNWSNGVDGVRQSTDALRGYAGDGTPILVATDQEGGLVQHLQGPGFETMPSAFEQGRLSTDALREDSRRWGGQLHAAGVDVDLAPSVDTVTIDRASNAPIGALDRDFGLDADGDARHATAFIEGMRGAGVATAVKHYPGLGSVTGNTDFTADGIVDTTTDADGPEVAAFTQAIRSGRPAMVMMSLASYTKLDPGVPAAFSRTIVTDLLRGRGGYDGVVISDSLSASAVGDVDPTQLGVRLVEAGGDVACINDPSYTAPILSGLRARASSDAAFADRIAASATRVVAMKIRLGLIR